jgi:hypothetical protein
MSGVRRSAFRIRRCAPRRVWAAQQVSNTLPIVLRFVE